MTATPMSRRARGDPKEQGQVTLEFLTLTPWLIIAGIAAFQAYVTVVAVERVNNAARAAARVESMGGNGRQAAAEALPGWLKRREPPRIDVGALSGTARARVEVTIPILYGLPYHYTVTRTVEMPVG